MTKNYFHAIALMLISSLCITLNGLVGKTLLISYALPLVMFLRYLFPTLISLWLAIVDRWPTFEKKYLIHYAIRSLFGLLSQYAWFFYLIHGSILDATLLLMTSPLFVPILLRLLQKTPIQHEQWFSIVIGFIGVGFILKPNQQILNFYALIGLCSGLFNALSQVYYHKIVKSIQVKNANLYMYSFSSIFALIPLIFYWHDLINFSHDFSATSTQANLFLFVCLAFIGMTSKTFRGKAYKKVDKASRLTPFLYMSIIFATIFDWIAYHQLPDLLSVIGALFILISGLIFIFFSTKTSEELLA